MWFIAVFATWADEILPPAIAPMPYGTFVTVEDCESRLLQKVQPGQKILKNMSGRFLIERQMAGSTQALQCVTSDRDVFLNAIPEVHK